MAKQKNQYYIGRQGNLLYYQWRDVFCIRTKGTLDKKRFYEDKAFEGSRKRAVEFGEASKLAAEVYHLLPQELKKRGFIGTLTGWAHKKLMNGKSKEAVKLELLKTCGVAVVETAFKETIVSSTFTHNLLSFESPYCQPSDIEFNQRAITAYNDALQEEKLTGYLVNGYSHVLEGKVFLSG
ncbi:hypothetical protein [Flavisolibacter tropicus]|uniref:Uncharacterized protein n=1 Tax=Flavisolibacter tropicus TaxID=1492898 RepID=A0A172TTN3_9BACT|nr:hypothetical protein [Flavisolibacter tropicus]ANE50234.1 hypothetical protein SY85_06690 [Flavisolibacter tropicus]